MATLDTCGTRSLTALGRYSERPRRDEDRGPNLGEKVEVGAKGWERKGGTMGN